MEESFLFLLLSYALIALSQRERETDMLRASMAKRRRQTPKHDNEALESRVERERNPIKRFLMLLGPGLITGASDDDPSGIGTYTTAGASLGFATLWTAILTLPMMAAVQFICAKIGMVSGRGLSAVLRKYYPSWLVYSAISLLVIANTVTAGVDIGAIAAAINLLIPIPALALVLPIAIAIVVLQIWGSYKLIVKIFKWLTLTLFAYVIAAFLARPHWSEVLKATFIPTLRFDNQYLMTLVAILGTTISPYLFFWQASQEVEEELQMGRATIEERKGASDMELRIAEIDIDVGDRNGRPGCSGFAPFVERRRHLSFCVRIDRVRFPGSARADLDERLCGLRGFWLEIRP